MKDNLTQILQQVDIEDRWTRDEHAEMALLVLVHDMPTEERFKFLAELDIPQAEYEYLTQKYSRPLNKLPKKEALNHERF